MIDLHLHTNMSDGSDAPLELLEKAEAAGCNVFSVTDHDDLRANAIILQKWKSKPYKTRFVTGCEIASVFEGRNLHLLCYGFVSSSEAVKRMTEEGARLRKQRITAMFGHLCVKHGIIIPDGDKADILSRAVPGKVHIADAAMKLGLKMNRQEFFDTCLDDMESREFKLPAEKVFEYTDAAGGYVSLAHPVEVQKEYGLDFPGLARMAERLKDAGLAAIEVYHSSHGLKEMSEYTRIAAETGLLVSGGSDYHGKNKDGVYIGKLNNCGFEPDDEEITVCGVL